MILLNQTSNCVWNVIVRTLFKPMKRHFLILSIAICNWRLLKFHTSFKISWARLRTLESTIIQRVWRLKHSKRFDHSWDIHFRMLIEKHSVIDKLEVCQSWFLYTLKFNQIWLREITWQRFNIFRNFRKTRENCWRNVLFHVNIIPSCKH